MSVNKQQPEDEKAKLSEGDAENDKVPKETYTKQINKNFKSVMRQTDVFDKKIFDINDEGTDLLKVIRNGNDLSSALLDIEVILRCFKNAPILFSLGDLFIHLVYDKLLYADALSTKYTKTIRLHELVDMCYIHKTFVAVGLDGDRLRLLPKTAMTYPLFNKLGILEESKRSTVSIRLQELMPFYYREKRRQRKNVSGNSMTEQKRDKHSFEIFHGTISIKNCTRYKFKDNKSRFMKVICPHIPRHLERLVHYPVEDELHHLPIQATPDDLDSVLTQGSSSELLPSSQHFYNYLLYDSPSDALSNDSASRSTSFRIQNVSSQLANDYTNPLRHQTELLTYNSERQPTDFHINDSSSTTSHRPTIPPRYERYASAAERAASFDRWPHQQPTSEQLTNAGFFFTNDGDLVRCFQCGIGLKDFSEDDDPLLEHVRHSGKCPYLPLHVDEQRLASMRRYLRRTDPEYYRRMQLNGDLDPDELSTYRHPEYRTIEARLSTFANWPSHLIQTPQRLAEAGLYYIGVEDHVRCFACDGGLRRWDPEDDPWTEHCRWFPACPFAIEQKGEQFIALIQASVENERLEASGAGGSDDIVSGMDRLRIRESEVENVIKQHDSIREDMGFSKNEFKDAVLELNDRGNKKPSIVDIVDVIEVIRDRKLASTNFSPFTIEESPKEENRRLKMHVFCMQCKKNNTNALFLPCTHHRLCMACAEPLQVCPVCRRNIKEKIRTYMV